VCGYAATWTKCLYHESVIGASRRRRGPRFIHQLRQPDLPTTEPWIIDARNHDQGLVIQRLHVNVAFPARARHIKAKLHVSLAQLIKECAPGGYSDVKDNARILVRQPIDRRKNNTFGNARGSSDPQFTGRWIGKKVDFLDP